jgi:thioredoxin 1
MRWFSVFVTILAVYGVPAAAKGANDEISVDDTTVTKPHVRSAEKRADQIVVYTANWCAPCQQLKPVLRSLKSEGYNVVYHDVDQDGDKLKYRYRSLPTIYFVQAGEVIKQETGYRSKEYLQKSLKLAAEDASFQAATAWK